MASNRVFLNCDKCGKPLVSISKETKEIFFRFGKDRNRPDGITPVIIYVRGPVEEFKMQCFRKDCRRKHPDHWNVVVV